MSGINRRRSACPVRSVVRTKVKKEVGPEKSFVYAELSHSPCMGGRANRACGRVDMWALAWAHCGYRGNFVAYLA
jgi:hypothetical protein